MIGAEFIDSLGKFHIPDYVGVEDFADKLSFLYSVLVLLLCTSIVTVKQYLLSAIACYIPTVPSGTDFDKFLENFCWVHGTIPFLPGEPMPQTLDEWAYFDNLYAINYYQWVPFVLGLQGMLFYLPRVFWQIICCNKAGTDLEHLVVVAHQAGTATPDDRRKLIAHVACSLKGLFSQRRQYRHNKAVSLKRRLFGTCGMLIASKRLGTWLAFTYFLVKIAYLVNSVGQLYLMQRFLGFNHSLSNFGIELVRYITSGRNWEDTRIFPRVSFCYLDDLRQLGSTNRYVAQCVLPVNMLNEKLYIFLWYWTAMVAICTAVSIPLWLLRLTFPKNRVHFIKKFLRINDKLQLSDKQTLRKFVDRFLGHDGVFLLRMISMNAGDVIASEVVTELWSGYCLREKCGNNKVLPTASNNNEVYEPTAPVSNKDSSTTEDRKAAYV